MTTYNIDASHSNIEFSIRHLVVAKVRGRFTRFSGALELDPADITRSRVSAEIEAASISTNEEKRDAHLRSADFFDAETFPLLTFASKRVEHVGRLLHVTGDLTIRGVTREAVLRVEHLGLAKDPWGNQRAAFSATTSIDRKDYGLHWNQLLEAGGVMVGEKVEITLDVEAVQLTAQAAA
ncbi:MAG TPA: YceI family protein [Kofleriaceae bacterium]|nr:YceI family protein [Kofleriaceae bacterium]